MKEFKKGYKVWSVIEGNGEVVDIDDSDSYPINVLFENGCREDYTEDGKFYEREDNRTLYHGHDLFIGGEVEPFEAEVEFMWVNNYKDGSCFHKDEETALHFASSDCLATYKVRLEPV